MDHEYAQPAAAVLNALSVDFLAHIIVILNGGAIDNEAKPKIGFLYPGYKGGRELHYFAISRDAMTFWRHVCKYLRHTYDMNAAAHGALLLDNTPRVETWKDPDMHEHCEFFFEDCDRREWYIPRHFYAGNPEPWMEKLCYGPQSAEHAHKEKRRLRPRK